MLQNTKKVFKIQLKSGGRVIPLPSVLISDVDAVCGDLVENEVFIQYQVPNVLTVGDVLYQDSAGSLVFIGGDNRYVISIDGGITTYAITVTDSGVIDTATICEEPAPRVLAQLSTSFAASEDVTCTTPTETTNVYIELTNPVQATNGDILYTTEFGATVFDGGASFYAMNIPSLVGSNQKTNIQITTGIINIVDLCL